MKLKPEIIYLLLSKKVQVLKNKKKVKYIVYLYHLLKLDCFYLLKDICLNPDNYYFRHSFTPVFFIDEFEKYKEKDVPYKIQLLNHDHLFIYIKKDDKLLRLCKELMYNGVPVLNRRETNFLREVLLYMEDLSKKEKDNLKMIKEHQEKEKVLNDIKYLFK